MAQTMLCRCKDHTDNGWIQEKDKGYTYVATVEPIGYPNEPAVFCGRDGCEEPALIFLDDRQYWQFEYKEKRIFRTHNRADAAVKVTDNVVRRRSDCIRPKRYGPDTDGNWPDHPKFNSAADW